MSDNRRSDVAVFIDFENIYVSVRDKLDANPNFEMIMDRCEDLGRVVIARAYADWYRYPRVTSALYANGVEPMYVPTYYYDRDLGRTGRAIKNSVDMNLCIDAMKTLYTNPNIGKFVLCTGDRDFIPLVNSIRQQGKEVIIIGIGGAASSHLAQSADEFIFYEALVGKRPTELLRDQPKARMPEKGREYEYDSNEVAPLQPVVPIAATPIAPVAAPTPAPAAQPDIFDVLVQAIQVARERDFVCSFGSLKLVMKELTGGEFREDRFRDGAGRPFAKFKDFVMEAERRGKVQVFTSGAMNEVFLPGEDPYKLSRFAMDLKVEPSATPEVPVAEEPRGDRQLVGGRRRRRRSRGRNQPTPVNGAQQAEELEELEELDELDFSFSEVIAEAGQGTDDADATFDDLLGQLEVEDQQHDTIGDLDALALLDAPTLPELIAAPEPEPAAIAESVVQPAAEIVPEMVEPSAVEAGSAEPANEVPFSDLEWSVLVQVVEAAGKPLSFVQIHDLMREARNNAGINRTNEELRSLVKQAINSGKLVRSGKGTRVNYRLAAPEVASDTTDQPPELQTETPAATPEPEALAETVQQSEPVAAPVEPKPARSRSRRKKSEPVASEAAVVEPAPPVAAVVEPVVVVAEPEEAKPARTPRRRKAPKEGS